MGSHLREGDADLMLGVVEEARRDPGPGAAVPWSLLEGLHRLVPCDIDIAYQRHVFTGQPETVLVQSLESDGDRWVDEYPDRSVWADGAAEFWSLWWSGWCSWPQRSGDLESVVMTTDFCPTEKERLASPLSDALGDVRSSIMVSMPAEPGHARRFTFFRHAPQSFSERDRQVLTLLRPHLHECYQRAERLRRGVPSLTPREWEVLALVAAGLSHAEVASALVVSVGTVRKHMEHVRERLGVSSAAAAAAVALPLAPEAVVVKWRIPLPRT